MLGSGLVLRVWVGDRLRVDTGPGTVVELLAGVETELFGDAEVPPAWPAMRGLSSNCWMIFTPSGLVQADSRVRAL